MAEKIYRNFPYPLSLRSESLPPSLIKRSLTVGLAACLYSGSQWVSSNKVPFLLWGKDNRLRVLAASGLTVFFWIFFDTSVARTLADKWAIETIKDSQGSGSFEVGSAVRRIADKKHLFQQVLDYHPPIKSETLLKIAQELVDRHPHNWDAVECALNIAGKLLTDSVIVKNDRASMRTLGVRLVETLGHFRFTKEQQKIPFEIISKFLTVDGTFSYSIIKEAISHNTNLLSYFVEKEWLESEYVKDIKCYTVEGDLESLMEKQGKNPELFEKYFNLLNDTSHPILQRAVVKHAIRLQCTPVLEYFKTQPQLLPWTPQEMLALLVKYQTDSKYSDFLIPFVQFYKEKADLTTALRFNYIRSALSNDPWISVFPSFIENKKEAAWALKNIPKLPSEKFKNLMGLIRKHLSDEDSEQILDQHVKSILSDIVKKEICSRRTQIEHSLQIIDAIVKKSDMDILKEDQKKAIGTELGLLSPSLGPDVRKWLKDYIPQKVKGTTPTSTSS